MFEELKDKKIRKLKAYKDIISSFKAIGYDIVDDIELVKFLDDICNLEEFRRGLSSIAVLCSVEVLSKLENMNYIIKNDKREDIQNVLEELSKIEKQFDIESPDILDKTKMLCHEEKNLNKKIFKQEFCKTKTSSSNINYVFVGNVNFDDENNKYFDKNGNRVDISKCSQLSSYVMNVCNTYTYDITKNIRHADTYLAISTEEESRYLFKKQEPAFLKPKLTCFSDNVTKDDLRRIYYMLSGDCKALEIFKEYLLYAFKRNKCMLSLVKKQSKYLSNIGQKLDFYDNQIYDFGDAQFAFTCQYCFDNIITYRYDIQAKRKNESAWKHIYHTVIKEDYHTGAKCDEYCYYAHKSAIVDELSTNYILENLGVAFAKKAFHYYLDRVYVIEDDVGEYSVKTI